MKLSKSIVGLSGLVIGIVMVAGLALNAEAGSNCGTKAKAEKTSASCTQAQQASSGGGCGAAKATEAGACGAAKATQACAGAASASAGCAAACGAKMEKAEVSMPKGTEMTRVDVDGGIDLVFAGNDMDGIESFLKAHMNVCGDEAKKDCGRTCSVARTDEAVILSIRGENPEGCCVGTMTAAVMGEEKKDAEKAPVEKS